MPDVDPASPFRGLGHPIHTRSLEVTVTAAPGDGLRAQSAILDLRKIGFVPTGGDLQTSGFIHHMSIDARMDRVSREVLAFDPAQAVVAFEASPRTGGESCRDTIGRLPELVGQRLDAGFARALAGVYGGALGCSHLLTLAHLVATTLPRAADWETEAGFAGQREPGEVVFKRTLILDGFELEGGAELGGAIQLNDVFTRPFSAVDRPLDRFVRQHEVRVVGRVAMSDMSFLSIDGVERVRAGSALDAGGWASLEGELASFVGAPAIRGLGRLVLDRYPSDWGESADGSEDSADGSNHLPDGSDRTALRDTLLNMAPGLIQCMAAFAHRMVEGDGSLGEGPSILQLGGLPDSCYIWREGGPGNRMRADRSAELGLDSQPGGSGRSGRSGRSGQKGEAG